MVQLQEMLYDPVWYSFVIEGLPLTGMMLPNAERAILDIRKLREYTLNPGHLAGGNQGQGVRLVPGDRPARYRAAALSIPPCHTEQ
jgi:hypothetical protein